MCAKRILEEVRWLRYFNKLSKQHFALSAGVNPGKWEGKD